MKTLLLCMILFLSGCSVISLPTYNESEYSQLIEIAVVSSESNCKTEEVNQLRKLSNRAVFYSAYLPHNGHIALGVAEMDKTIRSLMQAQVDSAYCHLKMRSITNMATTLAESAGGKPK